MYLYLILLFLRIIEQFTQFNKLNNPPIYYAFIVTVQPPCHCERSEAISGVHAKGIPDCFVVPTASSISLLAMTEKKEHLNGYHLSSFSYSIVLKNNRIGLPYVNCLRRESRGFREDEI